MSGNSSVGTSGVYEAGDQRNYKDSEISGASRYEEGKENSHKPNDSKDERSIANRLANEERKQDPADDPETGASKKDPTLPAKLHGNEPSKGAKIDAELKAEEEETLKKKGKAFALVRESYCASGSSSSCRPQHPVAGILGELSSATELNAAPEPGAYTAQFSWLRNITNDDGRRRHFFSLVSG
ncbi:hypothetical protein GGR56DRAFT_674404 [Xylariaceae sp. FL0804]|nr:hypothetical protein GGR56DRAFT_674404 [Xylariaceae sp. FL0804]